MSMPKGKHSSQQSGFRISHVPTYRVPPNQPGPTDGGSTYSMNVNHYQQPPPQPGAASQPPQSAGGPPPQQQPPPSAQMRVAMQHAVMQQQQPPQQQQQQPPPSQQQQQPPPGPPPHQQQQQQHPTPTSTPPSADMGKTPLVSQHPQMQQQTMSQLGYNPRAPTNGGVFRMANPSQSRIQPNRNLVQVLQPSMQVGFPPISNLQHLQNPHQHFSMPQFQPSGRQHTQGSSHLYYQTIPVNFATPQIGSYPNYFILPNSVGSSGQYISAPAPIRQYATPGNAAAAAAAAAAGQMPPGLGGGGHSAAANHAVAAAAAMGVTALGPGATQSMLQQQQPPPQMASQHPQQQPTQNYQKAKRKHAIPIINVGVLDEDVLPSSQLDSQGIDEEVQTAAANLELLGVGDGNSNDLLLDGAPSTQAQGWEQFDGQDEDGRAGSVSVNRSSNAGEDLSNTGATGVDKHQVHQTNRQGIGTTESPKECRRSVLSISTDLDLGQDEEVMPISVTGESVRNEDLSNTGATGVDKHQDHQTNRQQLSNIDTTESQKDRRSKLLIRSSLWCSNCQVVSNKAAVPDVVEEDFNTKLLSLLECPVCLETIVPPIHQCSKGHPVCNQCRPRLTSCPTCRTQFIETRNLLMENIAEMMQFPCKNHAVGCTVNTLLKEKTAHEMGCGYRQYSCIEGTCEWKGYKQELVVHCNRMHYGKLIITNAATYNRVKIPFEIGRQSSWVISAMDEVFLVTFKVFEHSILRGGTVCLGPSENAGNYMYYFKFIGMGSKWFEFREITMPHKACIRDSEFFQTTCFSYQFDSRDLKRMNSESFVDGQIAIIKEFQKRK